MSDTALFNLTGYKLEVKCRKYNARGGGVGAYIQSSITYDIKDFEVTHAESLWLQMNINRKKVIIGIVYGKPNTNVDEFQNSLLDILSFLKIDKVNCILVGDFNINILDSDQKVEEFKTALQCFGLEQVITTPTRVTKLTSSLIIMHIPNFNISSKVHAGVIETDVSDHFPIFVVFENCEIKNKDMFNGRITVDEKQFQDNLEKISWDLVFNKRM